MYTTDKKEVDYTWVWLLAWVIDDVMFSKQIAALSERVSTLETWVANNSE